MAGFARRESGSGTCSSLRSELCEAASKLRMHTFQTKPDATGQMPLALAGHGSALTGRPWRISPRKLAGRLPSHAILPLEAMQATAAAACRALPVSSLAGSRQGAQGARPVQGLHPLALTQRGQRLQALGGELGGAGAGRRRRAVAAAPAARPRAMCCCFHSWLLRLAQLSRCRSGLWCQRCRAASLRQQALDAARPARC